MLRAAFLAAAAFALSSCAASPPGTAASNQPYGYYPGYDQYYGLPGGGNYAPYNMRGVNTSPFWQ